MSDVQKTGGLSMCGMREPFLQPWERDIAMIAREGGGKNTGENEQETGPLSLSYLWAR